MNPLTNVKNITKLNEIELASGSIHKKSWHDIYKDSAWIFIGGLEYGLTEGDIITVFSQYGETVNLNLVRDKKTGKSKGFCFLCYANQKSTVLAVDNLNGIKLCNRTIRVDHVANYKPPKEDDRDDEITKMLKSEGCAPKHLKRKEDDIVSSNQAKKKKTKKEKKEKKKKKRKHSSSERDSTNKISSVMNVKIKKEKPDSGYDKYDASTSKFCDDEGKEKHQDKTYDHSRNENLHAQEIFRSRSDQLHHMPNKKDNFQNKDNFFKRHRSKERSVSEYQHKERGRDQASVSKRVKKERSRSSSSEDSSRNRGDSTQYKPEKTQSKSKRTNSERRVQEREQSTSSSSDEDSSSDSSLDDEEKHKSNNRQSRRDKYKSYEGKKSHYEERRDKSDHKSDNSNYTSHRSRHHDKNDRDLEYRSKNKCKTNEGDNDYRDSYHRNRYDKR